MLPQYFDTLGIREEVKRDLQLLEENLWKHDLEDSDDDTSNKKIKLESKDVPGKYAQAYLYKIMNENSKKKAFLPARDSQSEKDDEVS